MVDYLLIDKISTNVKFHVSLSGAWTMTIVMEEHEQFVKWKEKRLLDCWKTLKLGSCVSLAWPVWINFETVFLTTLDILPRSSGIHYWRKTTGSQTIVSKNNTNKYTNMIMLILEWRWCLLVDGDTDFSNDCYWFSVDTKHACALQDVIIWQFIGKTRNISYFCVSVHHLSDDYFPNYKTPAWHSLLIE